MSQTGQVEQVFVTKKTPLFSLLYAGAGLHMKFSKVLVISVKCSPSGRTPSGQSDPVE